MKHIPYRQNFFKKFAKSPPIRGCAVLRVYERGHQKKSPAFAAAKGGENMNEPNRTQWQIRTSRLRLPFGLCCFMPTYPLDMPTYLVSVRQVTISLWLLLSHTSRYETCQSLSSSSVTTPLVDFHHRCRACPHTKKHHVYNVMFLLISTSDLVASSAQPVHPLS